MLFIALGVIGGSILHEVGQLWAVVLKVVDGGRQEDFSHVGFEVREKFSGQFNSDCSTTTVSNDDDFPEKIQWD